MCHHRCYFYGSITLLGAVVAVDRANWEITSLFARKKAMFPWFLWFFGKNCQEKMRWNNLSSESCLRATASKYRESADSKENSDFLFWRQKDPFGQLFSEIYFQSSSEFTFLWNLGKFKIQLNQPRWPMEFIQNSTFLTRLYRKMGTCLGLIFTQFVVYSLVILLS